VQITLTNKCIPNGSICDGINDCGNFEDEKNCNEATCGSLKRIACSDGSKCILKEELCDRHNECRNKFDESRCTRNSSSTASSCPFEMFTCHQSQRCISPRLVCDGNKDCENNEDEENCDPVEDFLEFQCTEEKEKGIEKHKVCDGKVDCRDKGDERNCTRNSPLCTKDMFVCSSSNLCLSRRLLCNGVNDCGNNEDEKNCMDVQEELSKLVSPGLPLYLNDSDRACEHHEFYCPRSIAANEECIPRSEVCNGPSWCSNGGDEINCNNKCFEGEYFCKLGNKCIPEEFVCDGESDCMNDEDETGCSVLETKHLPGNSGK